MVREEGSAYIPAGWYPDHTGEPQDRYWDGQAWTDQVRLGTPTAPVAPEPDPEPEPSPVTTEVPFAAPATTPGTVPPAASTVERLPGGLPGTSTSPVPTGPPKRRTGRILAFAAGVAVLMLLSAGVGFVVGRVTAPDTIAAVGNGQVGGTLEVGDRGTGRVGFGSNVTFELVVTEQQQVTIDSASNDIDSHLSLLDEDGNLIAENDDFVECCDSRVQVELAPGSYRIVVRDLGNSQTGDIEVRVS